MIYTSPAEIDFTRNPLNTIFIAGGISGCEDWQSEIVDLIDTDRYDVYNPRRPEGLEKTGEAAAKQIRWEHDALASCGNVVFWFPSSSICPITLFEYGVMLERARRGEVAVLMGRDPDYARAFDLDVQTFLVVERAPCPEIAIAADFDEFRAGIQLWYGK